MSQPNDIAAALDDLVTVEQMARALHVQPGTVRQHVHAQVTWLPAPTRLGARLYWTREQLDAAVKDKPQRLGRPKRTPPPDASPDPS